MPRTPSLSSNQRTLRRVLLALQSDHDKHDLEDLFTEVLLGIKRENVLIFDDIAEALFNSVQGHVV